MKKFGQRASNPAMSIVHVCAFIGHVSIETALFIISIHF